MSSTQNFRVSNIDYQTSREVKYRCGGIVEAFFKNLSPDEKELFKATTIADDLLEEITVAEQLHRDKSLSKRVSQAIKPFLAGVNQYGRALDVLSNSSSLVLCPLWGGVRIVLHLATEFGEYFEKLTNLLQQVGLNLNSLRRFPRLYPHNDRLASAMVDVYQKIFDFLKRARKVFIEAKERRSLKICIPIGLQTMSKLIWKPFKAEFGELQGELSACMERVEAEVDLAEKEEAHLERERAEKERRAQSFRWEQTQIAHAKFEDFLDDQNIAKVSQWLAPVDVEPNHTTAKKLRHSGTGRWFLQSDIFRSWLSSDNAFLWVHAIPGAGKTILMSSAIEYLKENVQSADVGLAYFYCDYKELQKQEPSRILCTLLCQLGKRNKTIFQRLQTFFQDRYKENPSFSPGFDELRGNFSGFLEGSCNQVLLVVDALDECTQRDCIARALKTINESCPLIKILVSSREEQEITDLYEELPNLKITSNHMAGDIESFVKAEVGNRIKAKKLKIRKPELQKTICERLTSRANGMFQWVKCQIDVLCTLGMDKLILKALEDLPHDLVGTYTRILQRIEREREQLGSVRRLLQWLVKGTRSLSLDELSECIGMDLDEETEAMDFDTVMTDPKDILTLCGSLVTLSSEGHVSLAHYTVKEFLISDTIRDNMGHFYVGGDEVEAELARTCLIYLNYNDFIAGAKPSEEGLRDLLGEYKFLEYASQSWAIHAHLCDESGVEEACMRLLQSDNEGRGNMLLWTQVFQSCRLGRRFVKPTCAEPVYYASLFGLPRALQTLLDEGMDAEVDDTENDPLKAAITEGHIEVVNILLSHNADVEPSRLEQYLYVAASKGHHALVLTLLEKGVSVDSQGGKQGTALQIAALEGHKDVVQVLLKHGASTKVVSARFGTPLSAAAEKGHQGCFQLLLNAGASIHGKGGWYAYPLVSALVGKNDYIIQILLNKGANVNLTGGRHVCPLMAASAVSKIEWVEKLIEAGAKVNDENDKGADALHSACCANRLDVVKLLLANGADVNAKGGKHRNALNAASSEGCLDIVHCLLEAGADASAFDENYGNALEAAVLGGHRTVIEVLAPGCDVNAPGGVRGTALVVAASIGDLSVLETLFNLGVQTGPTEDMANALVAAAAKGHDEVIDILLAKDADINAAGNYKVKIWTPLQVAANKGNLRTVGHLLRSDADPNVVTGYYGTALLAATDTTVVAPHESVIIEQLIDAGAIVNKVIDHGCGSGSHVTALGGAVGKNNMETTRILLSKAADINLFYGTCWTTLQCASRIGNPAMLELLFEHGADPNIMIVASDAPGDDGLITPLQEAAHNGSDDIIRLLVSKGADLVLDRNDSQFKSALHAASFAGQVDNVKVLIELGSDINCQGGFYGTSLQAAAFKGKVEVMKVLLDAGADINASNTGHYGTALMAALAHDNDDNLEAVKLLLDNGADPSLRASTEFRIPLQAACWHGSDEIVNALIAAGADINAKGGIYHSALQAAACEGQSDIMAALINAGAEVDATGGMYGTAFEAAYRHGYYICTNLLYDHGASNRIMGGKFGAPLGACLNGACQTLATFFIKRHDANTNGYLGPRLGSPMHHCIRTRWNNGEDSDAEYIVDMLMEYGADVNGLNSDGLGGYFGTPLNCASAVGSLSIMRKLLDAGADLHLCGNRNGWTALQLACLFQNDEATDLLLEEGADVNAHGKYGTPLQAAAYKGSTHTAKKLLARGARLDVSNQGRYGHALQSAVIRGHEDVAKLLIRQGADINVEGGRFGSVLQAAAMRCNMKFVKFLIKKGANVNSQEGRFQTALQAAAAAGRRKVIQILLKHGAEVNTTGGRYGSALQAACVFGKLKAVRMLVNHGANVNVKGGFYGSALSAAANKGRMDIVNYLIHEAGVAETSVDRRPDNQSNATYDNADQLLQEAREAEYQNGKEDQASEVDAEVDNEEELTDVDAPDIVASEASDAIASDSAGTSITSSTEEASSIPKDMSSLSPEKRYEAEERAVEMDKEIEEVLSPFSWLQVECGYGGDLSGTGR